MRPPPRRYFRHGMLPQLIAFEACVRLGSVTRAAHELSLAQPTVSCMLRKLSDTMGGPVTVLRDRRIEPTDLGRELLTLAHELFGAFQRFEARRYHAAPDTVPPSSPWPSSFPESPRSTWTRRVSPSTPLRLVPEKVAGAS